MTAAPRIVVADDSALMRRVVVNTLKGSGFDVVGEAADGDQALALCRAERPDAMTLDLAMPGRDGIAVLKQLAAESLAVPTVVVSAFSPRHGARAVDALAEGAFELVAKPATPTAIEAFATELAGKVGAAAFSRRGAARRATAAPAPAPAPAPVARRPGVAGTTARVAARATAPAPAPAAAQAAAPAEPVAAAPAAPSRSRKLLVIACSTGGPKALASLVPALPSPLGAGTLIVQHMPPGFTSSLAARLDGVSPLHVQEAGQRSAIAPGGALLAPGGWHLRLDKDGRPRLSDEPEVGALRPRADLTIVDAARLWGPNLVLVVLTGMGKDGLEGAREVRRRGGRILVEDESTCTVYGMPRAIAEAGLADVVAPLDQLPPAIVKEIAR